jgi:hypothetical protein
MANSVILSHEASLRTGMVNCGCDCGCTRVVHWSVNVCGSCEPSDARLPVHAQAPSTKIDHAVEGRSGGAYALKDAGD